MSLSDIGIDAISEADVTQLIADGVQEGVRIEYKRQTYGSSDSDKKEYLKDASSFANSYGGNLILGLDAVAGVPTAIVPFVGDADGELLRLESLLRDGVEPRINGVQMRAVSVAGGHVFVVRVPRSWNPPHRVAFKGSNRFYARSSAGAFELGVEELRAKFNSSAAAFQRAASFRDRRLALLASNEGIMPLARDAGRLTIHVLPLGNGGEAVVDLDRAFTDASELLQPIGRTGYSSEFNFDGFANFRSGKDVYGYTQIFRDGSIEATKVRILASEREVSRIPARSLGDAIIAAVPDYITALQRLNVSPPFSVMVTLDGVRGSYLGYSQSQWIEDPAIIRRDTLPLPAVLIDDFGPAQAYQSALRPAFDALWNAGGLSACTYFGDDGSWRPHN
ncbi:MAG: ATP-binding protein [Hyphomicrobiales bacterium]|nr:MAG: ATP-binding protein [Hyphomicrobiales bacterium]